MAKTEKKSTEGPEKSLPKEPREDAASEAPALSNVSAEPARNRLRRASVVIQEQKIAPHVGAAVLAEHGLTQRSMVDPVTFKQQVASWLAAPVHK